MDAIAGVTPPNPTKKFRSRLLILLLALVLLGVGANIKLREFRQIARRASCANDLKQLWLYLAPYTEEHSGLYPAISHTRGNIMMDPAGFYPEFMTSSAWAQCEFSDARRQKNKPDETDLGPAAFNDDSFYYLPWEITNEAEGLAFIEAYKTLDPSKLDDDLSVTIDGQIRLLPRSRIFRYGSTDSATPVGTPTPIMVEWPTRMHANMCVLYSDGSVHRMQMGEEFPMTEAFFKGMRDIADLDGSISRRENK